MNKIPLGILICIALSMNSPMASSEIYRWKDENGNVHYSATKPRDSESESIKVRNKPSSDAERMKKNLQQKREAAAAAKQKDGPKESFKRQASKEQCDLAKSNLETLSTGIRVKRTDEKTGEISYLDDEARNEEKSYNKNFIDMYCSNPT